VDVSQLTELAPRALEMALSRTEWLSSGLLADVDALEVSLVSEDEIARIHGEFLDDPTPTDVITFDHGELIIGVEGSRRGSGGARLALGTGTASLPDPWRASPPGAQRPSAGGAGTDAPTSGGDS